MNTIFDVEETREIVSVLDDQLSSYGLNRGTLVPEVLNNYIDGIKNGLILVKGQVVFLKSFTGVINLGKIPAVVIDVTKLSSTVISYELMVLAGDLNGELLKVNVLSSKLTDSVTVTDDMTEVMTAIKDTRLGFDDLLKLKINLNNIPRLYILDNEKFISHL